MGLFIWFLPWEVKFCKYWSGWCCSQKSVWFLWHVPFPVASLWWESSDNSWAVWELALWIHTFLAPFGPTQVYEDSEAEVAMRKNLPVPNFSSRDAWNNFLPVCICLLKSLQNAFWWYSRTKNVTDVKLLLPHRSCCSHGGNLNFGCWHTVLESNKRDCVH